MNVSVAIAERVEYRCAIDWSRLEAIPMYVLSPEELAKPSEGVLFVDVMDGNFIELTESGHEVMRWEDGRLKAIAAMMQSNMRVPLPHLN